MAILISPLRNVTGHRVPSAISFSMGLSLYPVQRGQRNRHFLTNGLPRTRSDIIAAETEGCIAGASWGITLSNSLSSLTLNSPKISCKRTTCSYMAFMILTPSYRNLKVSCPLPLRTRQSTYPINRTRRRRRRFLPYFLILQTQNAMSQCTLGLHRMQHAGEAISICNSYPITLSILADNSLTGDFGGMIGNPNNGRSLNERPQFC